MCALFIWPRIYCSPFRLHRTNSQCVRNLISIALDLFRADGVSNRALNVIALLPETIIERSTILALCLKANPWKLLDF